MSLTPSPGPAVALGPRAPIAWILAVLLVGGASAAVVVATVTHSSASTGGPLEVTDDLGRSVHLTPNPARVVALGPSVVDILYRMGLRSHVVGVDCYNGTSAGALSSDYTPAQIALWNLTAAMCVEADPFVPSTLVNLTPDLILATTIVSITNVESAASEIGVPLVFLQPATIDGILLDVLLVGQIFEAQSTAAGLNTQMTLELANASAVTSVLYVLPTVLATYSVDENGYWTYGPGSFGESLLELAGASDVGAVATTPYPELSAEQVFAVQPGWIICALGFGLDLGTYAAGPGWTTFAAVEHGNVTGVDSTWLTEPDPTMVLDGLPALLAIFHPPTG